MRRIKRKFLAVTLVVMMFMMNTFMVSAAEPKTEALYDLEKGGTQTFVIGNSDGEIQRVTIKEIATNARVASGTYEVAFETSNWEAGFYVTISRSSNKITSAYSPFHTALRGSIKDATLVRNSNIKATYSFIFQLTILKFNTGVIAEISDSNLVVSQK